MDQRVQLETLAPDCQQYACNDSFLHAAREPMTNLIDIHQVAYLLRSLNISVEDFKTESVHHGKIHSYTKPIFAPKCKNTMKYFTIRLSSKSRKPLTLKPQQCLSQNCVLYKLYLNSPQCSVAVSTYPYK